MEILLEHFVVVALGKKFKIYVYLYIHPIIISNITSQNYSCKIVMTYSPVNAAGACATDVVATVGGGGGGGGCCAGPKGIGCGGGGGGGAEPVIIIGPAGGGGGGGGGDTNVIIICGTSKFCKVLDVSAKVAYLSANTRGICPVARKLFCSSLDVCKYVHSALLQPCLF